MRFTTPTTRLLKVLNVPVSKFLVSFLLLFSLTSALKAQDINTALQVIPPYSASLKDYANVTNVRFTGFISCITCNNVELTPKRIKLRLIISKENAVIAYSNDIVSGETVMTLQNGASLTLGLELNNYFKFENLQGISADNYNHLLADGSCTINFQVLDYLTSAKIGSLSTSISITTNDAPVLIAPRNGENVQVTTNTTIPFSWSAPISQSGFQTNYEYTLVGIADELGDINQQFLTTTPIKTTTTNIPNLTIDAAQLQLVPAKTYAWRVHAIANSGAVPLSLFKNDGYSEIFAFKYNGACAIPTGLQVQAKAADQINVSWSPSTVHYQFRVAYRKYSTTQNNQWVEQTTTNNFLNLTALEPNTTYEIKLGGVCGTNLVSYTQPLQATTLAAGVVNGVVCGQQPTIGTLSQTPLATLFINDIIMAGDFPVTITFVNGSNGTFSGEGWIKVPWLADTKIAVKFTNISVNTDKKLIAGYIETSYVPNSNGIINLDSLFNPDINNEINLDFVVGSISLNQTTQPFQIEISNNLGVIVQKITIGSNYIVTDKNGVQYTISKNGAIAKLNPIVSDPIKSTGSGKIGVNSEQLIDIDAPIIVFENGKDSKFGFDKKSNKSLNNYEVLPCSNCSSLLGGSYSVPWKSVASGDSDIITARIVMNPRNISLDSIFFITSDGRRVNALNNGDNTWRISVFGTTDRNIDNVYAVVNTHYDVTHKKGICGKVNLASYDIIKLNINLVPVNGFGLEINLNQFQIELSNIFKQAIVDIKIDRKTNWQTNVYDSNSLLNVENSIFSVYSSDEKKIINEYENQLGLSNETNLLNIFLLNKAQNDVNNNIIIGHTPIGKKYSFIFTGNSTITSKQIGHEIGHGNSCGLEHIFEDKIIAQLNPTDNLMDYGIGTDLYFSQWNDLRTSKIRLGLFTNSDDALIVDATTNGCKGFKELVKTVKEAETKLINSDPKFVNILQRIKTLRGIYYGTTWSFDYKQMQSTLRNAGFNAYCCSYFSYPEDPTKILNETFVKLFNSPEVPDGDKGVDFGHIMIGLEARWEACSRSIPQIDANFNTGLEGCTWVGDLGGGAGMLAYRRSTNSPNKRAKDMFIDISNYGGWFNIEGNIAAYLIGREASQTASYPQLQLTDKDFVSDVLSAYLLPPSLENSDWSKRAKLFLTTLGGNIDANGNLSDIDELNLINKLEDQIERFSLYYLINMSHSNSSINLYEASKYLKGSSLEMAQIFVNILKKVSNGSKKDFKYQTNDLDPEPHKAGEPYDMFIPGKVLNESMQKIKKYFKL